MSDTPATDLLRRRALGRGLSSTLIQPGLDVGRDLKLARTARGTIDLATVDGVDNLTQCLELGLTTALGSDLFNTTFGFDGINALVDGTSAILTRERVRISVIKLLQADSRVSRIIDLQVVDGRLQPASSSGDATGSLAEQLAAWGRLAVHVSFQVITGDQATVALGKAVNDA